MVGIFAATQIFVFFLGWQQWDQYMYQHFPPCILSIHAGSHRPFIPWMCHGEIETWQSTVQVPKPRDFFTEQLGGWILPVALGVRISPLFRSHIESGHGWKIGPITRIPDSGLSPTITMVIFQAIRFFSANLYGVQAIEKKPFPT